MPSIRLQCIHSRADTLRGGLAQSGSLTLIFGNPTWSGCFFALFHCVGRNCGFPCFRKSAIRPPCVELYSFISRLCGRPGCSVPMRYGSTYLQNSSKSLSVTVSGILCHASKAALMFPISIIRLAIYKTFSISISIFTMRVYFFL